MAPAEMEAILTRIGEVWGEPQAAGHFLITPIPALNNRTPIEKILAGQSHEVDEFLTRIEHGILA